MMADLQTTREDVDVPESSGTWECGTCDGGTFILHDNNWITCDECGTIQNEVKTIFVKNAKPEWGKQYNDCE